MTQDMPNTVATAAAELNKLREGPFWQRQRELTQGRIEDPAIKVSWWRRLIAWVFN